KDRCYWLLYTERKIYPSTFWLLVRVGEVYSPKRGLNERMVPLEAIVPAAQNNINTQFILLEKGKITWDGQNKMCLGLVADKTAAVHLQLWGEECEAFEAGDIIRMENGIFSYNKNNLVLRAGRRGKVEKVGDFTMEFVETPNLSEVKWVPDPNNSNKYVQHSVISPHSRIFPPIP
ncbi:hypothetical protein Golax_004728, partial [Gossypium laxum]|nr:hypothetical protein [Gossypium laxum]